MKRLFLISLLLIFIAGCASNPRAPVVNRSPQAGPPAATNTSKPGNTDDWRPDTYVVKPGDTLYSIGLNHGYDYREIAAANNIPEPYAIKVGQRLSFASLKNKDAKTDETPASYENEDGVIVSAVDVGEDEVTTTTASSVVTPILSTPKAVREPYSQEAYNRTAPPEQPAVVTQLPTSAVEAAPDEAPDASVTPKPTVVSTAGWSWPTQGKVIAGFNAASNKGIDIAGSKGQAITASAAGKVIYAGSDLRGYGKLVIIKHDTTFLSVYAHNNKILVKEGQSVTAGQKIAEMGDSDSNRVKLHFEIRERGKSVDPAKYLPQN